MGNKPTTGLGYCHYIKVSKEEDWCGGKWIQGRHVLLIFATHFCLLAAAFTDSSLAIADGVIWYTYKAATTKSLVDIMKDFKKELVVVEW